MRVGSAEVGGLIEVVEFVHERRPRLDLDHRHRPARPLAPAPRATTAARRSTTLRLSYGVAGSGIWGWLAERVSAPTVRGHLRRSLQQLKRQVEHEQLRAAAADAPPLEDGRRVATDGFPALAGSLVVTPTTGGSTMKTRTWVVVLTALGSLMAALDTLVVATALSTIRLDLHASVEQLEWTVNAYNLSFAVLLMTGAALGDRYGRRSFYALGLGLFAAASAACALAPGAGWLIAARAVQGAGAALLMPLGLALLSAAFPPERRGAAIGIFSAITGISVASGPLIGGAVVAGRQLGVDLLDQRADRADRRSRSCSRA